MPIPTRPVSINLQEVTGVAHPNAKVRFSLTHPDVYNDPVQGALVPPTEVITQCDAAGLGLENLFPNDLGTQGTQYLVEVFDEYGLQVYPSPGRRVPATVLDLPGTQLLHAILFMIPPLSQQDAQWYLAEIRRVADQIGGGSVEYPAAQALGGHRGVLLNLQGQADYASNDTLNHALRVIGITEGAAIQGAQVSIKTSGELTEGTWTWTPGLPVFLGANGVLTQAPPAPPAAAFTLVLGVAINATSIFVGVREPIALS